MLTDEEINSVRAPYVELPITCPQHRAIAQAQEEATLKAVGAYLRSQAHETTVGYLFITRELNSVIIMLEDGQMPEVKE